MWQRGTSLFSREFPSQKVATDFRLDFIMMPPPKISLKLHLNHPRDTCSIVTIWQKYVLWNNLDRIGKDSRVSEENCHYIFDQYKHVVFFVRTWGLAWNHICLHWRKFLLSTRTRNMAVSGWRALVHFGRLEVVKHFLSNHNYLIMTKRLVQNLIHNLL